MPSTRTPYRDRINIVKRIITEAEEPIGYTDLYKRLIKETGVHLSKQTLSKCLDDLCTQKEINKSREKGVGNPVKYSLNLESNSIPRERIAAKALISEQLVNDYSNIFELKHWRIIGGEISEIGCQLVNALYEYSNRNDGKELEAYQDRIEKTLVPHMLEIHKLVKYPLTMSEKTTKILSERLFEKNIKSFLKLYDTQDKDSKEEIRINTPYDDE